MCACIAFFEMVLHDGTNSDLFCVLKEQNFLLLLSANFSFAMYILFPNLHCCDYKFPVFPYTGASKKLSKCGKVCPCLLLVTLCLQLFDPDLFIFRQKLFGAWRIMAIAVECLQCIKLVGLVMCSNTIKIFL